MEHHGYEIEHEGKSLCWGFRDCGRRVNFYGSRRDFTLIKN